MQKDFHYYLIYMLLLDCGYKKDDAEIIAYISQYVDDNNEHQYLNNELYRNQIRVGDHLYHGIITQTFSLDTFTNEIQYYVLIPFHFLPGNNPALKLKGKTNYYATMPAARSPIAEDLLAEVLESDNIYRLGVVLHALVDTYSHQNFSGIEESWNSVYPWYSPYSFAPNIGHAEVGQQPDTISDCWHDKRFPRPEQKIINRDRAMEAVEYIFRKLYVHKNPEADIDSEWALKKSTYKAIICGSPEQEKNYDYDERIEAIKKQVNRPDLKYNRKMWLEEAVKYNKKEDCFEAISPQTFIKSHYWQFQIAARKQVASVWQILSQYLL